MSWMSKLSKAELKDRDARKGVLPQREKPAASKVRPVLLEYFVEEYQVGWRNSKAGWCKQGRYKSREQAIRVIEGIQKAHALNQNHSHSAPTGCKWRIDRVEVEGL